MRLAQARICMLVSSLACLNFLVFVVFAPKQWKLGHIFHRNPYKVDISMIRNATFIPYELHLNNTQVGDSCQENSELLVGNITVNLTKAEANYWTLSDLTPPTTNFYNGSELGRMEGDNTTTVNLTAVFQPDICEPAHSVAIIIPFRDRESHLRILLGHLIPILRKQQIRYSIFVVEQLGEGTFNKGRLMNTGFEFARATGERFNTRYECFIFQDVDLLTEFDTLLHRCTSGNAVYHLSTTIDKFDYKPLCCGMTVGGVLAFGEQQFQKVNGFPNTYWGWGGEDDDINKRIRYKKLNIARPKPPLGRYTMIKHERDKGNPYNTNVNRNVQFALRRYRRDGLSSLDTKITKVQNYPLFTRVMIDVGQPPK